VTNPAGVPSSGDDEEFPVVSSEEIYRGKIISLRKDVLRMSDGSEALREIVEHPGAVGIVALDDEDRIVMVNQFRPALRARLDELPAGLLDVDGEPALRAAERELAEEAKLEARDWKVLLDLHPSPGFSQEAIRIYLARGLTDARHPDGFVAEHEEITMDVSRVPFDDAVGRVLAGDITNSTAAAGILAAAVARARGWTGLREPSTPWPARPGR
jgi:ADP-ribose pyrophosphatase